MMLTRLAIRSNRLATQARHIFETKNTINETRKKYYEKATNPTYLKEPGDNMVTAVAFGGVGIGLVTILYGLYSMSFGINKK
jgi:Cytochrome c oxidase subunit VII